MSDTVPTKLSVNLNAIALLRNRRDLPWPSVTGIGQQALAAGAHGLTVHPRPDERHIRFSDLPEIRALMDDGFPDAEFNIEGYPSEAFLQLVERMQPEQATLVPDDPRQATSDHGWDFHRDGALLKPIVARLKNQGMRVALFADANAEHMQLAAHTGADRVELYTGPYGGSFDNPSRQAAALELLGSAGDAARALGLEINAGHDLTLDNLTALKKRLPFLREVSIGHGLTADALQFGMAETVKRYLRVCGHDV